MYFITRRVRTSVNIFVSDTIPRRLHLRMHLCTTYCDLQTIKYTTTVVVCSQGNTNNTIILHRKLTLLNCAQLCSALLNFTLFCSTLLINMGNIRPMDMGPFGAGWVQVYEGSGFEPQDQQPYPKPYPCTPYPSEAYTNWDNISIKNNQLLLHILKTREQIESNGRLENKKILASKEACVKSKLSYHIVKFEQSIKVSKCIPTSVYNQPNFFLFQIFQINV